VKHRLSSTHKKVVVRKLDKSLVRGYVDPRTYLSADGVELLESEGRLVNVPLDQIKGVFFVRDFGGNPQHTERKIFHSRPRLSGLWVRMIFKDSEVLEGLTPNNLLSLNPSGFYLTPPDVYSNNLRIFVPRSSLTEVEVLGVIRDGRLRSEKPQVSPAAGRATELAGQIGLFGPSGAAQEKAAIKD
jgi:hypothetical protein